MSGDPCAERMDNRPSWVRRPVLVFGWYLFLALPIADLLSSDPSPARLVAVLAGVAAFLGVSFRLWRGPLDAYPPPVVFATAGVNMAIAGVLTVADRPSWGLMFVFLAPITARLPVRLAIRYLAALVLLASGLTWVGGGSAAAISFGASCLGVGFLMMNLGEMARTNRALREARAELAELAVADERLRFARDLHDLLGHGLSVIAIKAELATRLLPDRPEEARRHVAELGAVARDGLVQVRQAVSGYRQPTLAAELVGARMALEAAGVDLDVEEPGVRLAPETDAVMAWTVREGTTNALRHSGARRVGVRVMAGLTEAVAEVTDDGRGPAGAPSRDGGHGLAGLRERAEALGGEVSAGPAPGGGFRLRVAVPRAPSGEGASAEPEDEAASPAVASRGLEP
jgi:two-component system sensor histidine kinase DesK